MSGELKALKRPEAWADIDAHLGELEEVSGALDFLSQAVLGLEVELNKEGLSTILGELVAKQETNIAAIRKCCGMEG